MGRSTSVTDITTTSTAIDQRVAGTDDAIVAGAHATVSTFDRGALSDILGTAGKAIDSLTLIARESAGYAAKEAQAAMEVASGDRGIAQEIAKSIRPEDSRETLVFYALIAFVAYKILS